MTDDPASVLRIYLFGASKGETIVLHLPDGRWGLVDYYSSDLARPRSHPAWKLLAGHGVKELAFVCLTHPHDDHFRGMSEVFGGFEVEAFWSPCGLDLDEFQFLKAYFKAAAEWADRAEQMEKATELKSIFDAVAKHGCRYEDVNSGRLLYPNPIDEKSEFKIWGLAPSSRRTREYKKKLLRSFRGGLFRGPVPRGAHNEASVALRLDFKGTRVVLGGDVESGGWLNVLEDHTSDLLTSKVVKISHHGSTNGYCEALWPTISTSGGVVAALTPYRRFGLPDHRAITHIRGHAGEVHTAGPIGPRPVPGSSTFQAAARLKMKSGAAKSDPMGCCEITVDGAGGCVVKHRGTATQVR
jgi:hypothetical protein